MALITCGQPNDMIVGMVDSEIPGHGESDGTHSMRLFADPTQRNYRSRYRESQVASLGIIRGYPVSREREQALLSAFALSRQVWQEELGGLGSSAVTYLLTNRIERELRSLGYRVMREFPVWETSGADEHQGYLDVVGLVDGRVAVAVEIDRANKRRSLTKLLQASSWPVVPVWVRWGTFKNLPSVKGFAVPPSIGLVEVPLSYLRGRVKIEEGAASDEGRVGGLF